MPNSEPLERSAAVVASLINHELLDADQWVAWAVAQLERSEEPVWWLAELATIYDRSKAVGLLRSVEYQRVEDELGCLWLKYERRQLKPVELLTAALEAAGGWDTGGCQPYQDELLDLLRRYEDLPRAGPERRAGFRDIWLATVELFTPIGARVAHVVGLQPGSSSGEAE